MVGDKIKDPHFYLSFNADLANDHVKNLKSAIARNWLFTYWLYDRAPRSETKIDYVNRFTGAEFAVDPLGILGGIRGKHTDGITIIDDPFKDEANKIDAKNVNKINGIIRDSVMSVPNPVPTAQIHIAGTAQTRDDIFFDESLYLENGGRYHFRQTPACSEADLTKDIAWPERWTPEELKFRYNDLGQARFKQEYLCVPAYETDPLLDRDMVEACINPALEAYLDAIAPGIEDIVLAAWDPARKRHSAHCSIFRVSRDRIRQLRSQFWDQVSYPKQLAWIRWAIKHYSISELFADNTNGVLTGYDDEGLIPREVNLVTLSGKLRSNIAHNLDRLITQSASGVGRKLELLPDNRQLIHLMAVDRLKLEATETKDGEGIIGHGDAFWSAAMALSPVGGYERGGDQEVRSIQDENPNNWERIDNI